MNKKLFLTLCISFIGYMSFSQAYSLSGSSYIQTFDNLASGLPLGWRVDSMVNPNAGLGNNAISRFVTTAASWTSSTRGFKNVASADGLVSTSTSTDQNASTDRALAVRRVSAVGWDDHDTLTSLSFNIANTTGLNGFNLSFKIQSLHTAAKRYNNWIVQYGLGATPSTFTTVTTSPATLTLDSNFTNTSVTVNFGTALNNQSQPVWIRIMPSDSTMGSGTRPLVALDDFNLTWTGTAVNNTPQAVSFTPAPGSVNVPVSTTQLTIDFDKVITIGTGNVTVNNLTDATNQVIAASTCTAAGTMVTIPGVTLLNGKNYAVQYDSTCFKWTTYNGLGIYNNTTWTFSTTPAVLPPVTSLNETFTNCNSTLLNGFTQVSVSGAQTWKCSNFGRTDSFSVYMNGGTAVESFDNEDWFITPKMDMSAMQNPHFHFWTKRRFSGSNTKEVLISNNYTGDVSTATWVSLVPNMSSLDSNNWNHISNKSVNANKATPFHVAFKYVSVANTPSVAEEWTLDDIYVTDGPVSVNNFNYQTLDMYVISHSMNQDAQLMIMSDKADKLFINILDVQGKVLYAQHIEIKEGKNKFVLPTAELSTGMYFIHAQSKDAKGVVKIVR